MSIIQHLLAFVVAVCLLITVHEFGHFWVARRLGFKVLRFSVGFGKTLWRRFGKDGTEYVIAAVPLGGYVKMLDEREAPVAEADLPRAFNRRPHWQRICVLLAGPAFNIIFAVLLLTGILLMSGIVQVRPVLGEIEPATVAGRAGLHAGDEITAINGHRVSSQRDALLDLLDAVSDTAPIAVTVRDRDGGERSTALAVPDPGERRRLTEPSALLAGLGVRFYEPPIPPMLGTVEPAGPTSCRLLRRIVRSGGIGVSFGDGVVRLDFFLLNLSLDIFRLVRRLGSFRLNLWGVLHLGRNGVCRVRLVVF